jgi:tripartite-type tricarboxylate transporter receptor subunit TctC
MIGAASVVNSAPDGYTILFVGPNNAIGQTLYKSLSFDHMRDTVPVAGLARLSNIMVVPPSLPVKTVAEFVAYAKANPGKLSYASSGNGTSVHMSAELFKMMTKLDMVHVPYKGSAAVYPDLLTGKVDVLFDNLPGALEFVKTGKLRALGVTTATRQNVLPEVPTVGETVPGYEASVFYGIAAPKGTPPEIVAVLNKSINDAQKDPVMLKRLNDLGSDPLPMTPAEFGKFTGDEIEKWAKVVKAANLSIE